MVTEKYNRTNGFEEDCDVIYGDTDSVMVNFRVPDNARAMELGREAAEYVSATFTKPIKLEFEKVCMPSLYAVSTFKAMHGQVVGIMHNAESDLEALAAPCTPSQ